MEASTAVVTVDSALEPIKSVVILVCAWFAGYMNNTTSSGCAIQQSKTQNMQILEWEFVLELGFFWQ